MDVYHTWRTLLFHSIQGTREKKRIARALGISVKTLACWATNQASPTQQQLEQLTRAIPQHEMLLRALIAEEFEAFGDELADAHLIETSASFSAYILDLAASVPSETRLWSIGSAILTEALTQLDPTNSHLSLSVVHCNPTAGSEPVRFLQRLQEAGRSLWQSANDNHNDTSTNFLGAESLAGAAVTTGQAQQLAFHSHEQAQATALPNDVLSAAAFPIQHGQRSAGCLLAYSTQSESFSSLESCDLLQNYAALLTLAFQPEDFYLPTPIALQKMPSLQIQQRYLAVEGQRILTYPQAQKYVWDQIAEELIQLQAPSS